MSHFVLCRNIRRTITLNYAACDTGKRWSEYRLFAIAPMVRAMAYTYYIEAGGRCREKQKRGEKLKWTHGLSRLLPFWPKAYKIVWYPVTYSFYLDGHRVDVFGRWTKTCCIHITSQTNGCPKGMCAPTIKVVLILNHITGADSATFTHKLVSIARCG